MSCASCKSEVTHYAATHDPLVAEAERAWLINRLIPQCPEVEVERGEATYRLRLLHDDYWTDDNSVDGSAASSDGTLFPIARRLKKLPMRRPVETRVVLEGHAAPQLFTDVHGAVTYQVQWGSRTPSELAAKARSGSLLVEALGRIEGRWSRIAIHRLHQDSHATILEMAAYLPAQTRSQIAQALAPYRPKTW